MNTAKNLGVILETGCFETEYVHNVGKGKNLLELNAGSNVFLETSSLD